MRWKLCPVRWWKNQIKNTWVPEEGRTAVLALACLCRLLHERESTSTLLKSLLFGVFHYTQANLIFTKVKCECVWVHMRERGGVRPSPSCWIPEQYSAILNFSLLPSASAPTIIRNSNGINVFKEKNLCCPRIGTQEPKLGKKRWKVL